MEDSSTCTACSMEVLNNGITGTYVYTNRKYYAIRKSSWKVIYIIISNIVVTVFALITDILLKFASFHRFGSIKLAYPATFY
jgi:hypothetical protein